MKVGILQVDRNRPQLDVDLCELCTRLLKEHLGLLRVARAPLQCEDDLFALGRDVARALDDAFALVVLHAHTHTKGTQSEAQARVVRTMLSSLPRNVRNMSSMGVDLPGSTLARLLRADPPPPDDDDPPPPLPPLESLRRLLYTGFSVLTSVTSAMGETLN